MRALVMGVGLATGRLFIDLVVEPKPPPTAYAAEVEKMQKT